MVESSPPETDSSLKKKPTWLSRGAMIMAGAFVAAALAAYAVGRLQTASKIDAAEARAAEALQKASQAELALQSERQRVKLLEARQLLHLTLLALDERNFGIAQQRLSQVSALLASEIKNNPLAELAAPISQYQLRATEDLSQHREQLLQWTQRFDALLPPEDAK